MAEPLRTYLDFAAETAYHAGKRTLEHFQVGVRAKFKPDRTPVTTADREAEAVIRERIERCFPDHAVLGEEFGIKGTEGATHRWLVDPIDGTKGFVRGVPLYAVLIGLEVEGRAEVGAAYFPALDEMLAAATGEGCWWNGRRARVSEVSRLEGAMVCSADVANFTRTGRAAEWERIQRHTYYRTGWGDAYGYMLVATGRAELMLDPLMNPWDGAPFPAILREAGGYFGDWSGNETVHGGEGLATTRALLPEVLRLIHCDGSNRSSSAGDPRPGPGRGGEREGGADG